MRLVSAGGGYPATHLPDIDFKTLSADLADGGSVAEADAIDFFSDTPFAQFALVDAAATPSAVGATVTLYTRALEDDTVYTKNPEVVWSISAEDDPIHSEVYSIGIGYHKLVISGVAVTGASAKVKFLGRNI